jgi:hypothetical protein
LWQESSEIDKIVIETMVSYYNHPFAMYQKNSGGSNLPYSPSPSAAAWYSTNYHHQPPNAAQFLGDSDGPPQPVYYPHHVFHQSSPDWAGHENYAAPPQTGALLQGPGSVPGNNGGPAGFLSINQATQNGNHANANEHISDGLQGLPSPPITVSGSDMSSPGAPNGSSSPQIHSRPTPVKSPYEWMKKPSYQSQPNPGKKCNAIFVCVLVLISNSIVHPHKRDTHFERSLRVSDKKESSFILRSFDLCASKASQSVCLIARKMALHGPMPSQTILFSH